MPGRLSDVVTLEVWNKHKLGSETQLSQPTNSGCFKVIFLKHCLQLNYKSGIAFIWKMLHLQLRIVY